MPARFDELVARRIASCSSSGRQPPADVAEIARALNRMNESYLLDAFGREPRISERDRVDALTGSGSP